MTNDSLCCISFGNWGYLYLGKNETHQLDISRTMYRDGQQKLTLQVGGRHKMVKNTLAGQTLVTSSATFNTVFSQAQYSSVVAGGYLTVNPGVEYGLSIWATTARQRPPGWHLKRIF